MPYVIVYSLREDKTFQCNVDESTAAKAKLNGATVSYQPFEGIPFESRYFSERTAASSN